MNVPDKLIVELWEFIRPVQEELAQKLLISLRELFSTSREKWYWYPFLRSKKTPGIYRRIVPANMPLVMVHKFIAEWMIANVPQNYDFGSRGMGVIPAVQSHQGGCSAILVDLKSAYDYITKEKLLLALKFRFPNTNPEVLNLLTYITTFDGSTPQGCISTGPMFNLVFQQADKHIALLKGVYPIFAITRYIDDILISFKEPESKVNFDKVEKRIINIIETSGFEVGGAKVFRHQPFEYLGIKIFSNRLELMDEKINKISILVDTAVKSEDPKEYRDSISRQLGWVKQVFEGGGVEVSAQNLHVLKDFERYYNKVGRLPKSLIRLLNQRF